MVCPVSAVVKAPVWPKDASAATGEEFAADSLVAWLGDREAKVRSVRGPSDGLILLLVMDLVGDLNRIDVARKALIDEINVLGGREFVAILEAQDGLKVAQNPTRNKERLIETIQSARVTGYPGLLDALEPAATIANRMLHSSEVRVAVLFLTDGRIDEYRGDYTNPVVNPSDSRDLSRRFGNQIIQEKINSLATSLSSSWAPLFFLHLEERTSDLEVAYQSGISKFAQTTGGTALFCRTQVEIPLRLRELLGRIEAHYTVKIDPPADLKGRVKLRLEDSRGNPLAHREFVEITEPVESKKGKK